MKLARISLLLILGEAIASLALTSGVMSAEYGRVELLRDRWGVPHVFAETDAGAMYGLGYATAEDRGFQMHYTLRIIQGRLAEVIGDVKKLRRDETALQNDRKMRCFGFYRAAKKVVEALDEDSLALLEAYAGGVNDCFQKNADKLHPLFDSLGLEPEPWTPADSIASWWHLAQFFATDGTRDLMHYRNLIEGNSPGSRLPPTQGGRGGPTRGGRGGLLPDLADVEQLPPDESTSVVQRSEVADAWIQRTRAFLSEHGFDVDDRISDSRLTPQGPKFSHAWVAGGRKTGTGAAILASDPQTPVTNPSLFYEFHVKGSTFDARGMGVAGSPAILIGWNRNVAWGVTALGADQADLFRLETDADHPDQYRFDGQWRPIQTIREEIKVKGGRSQSITIRQTHFGPIVNEFAFSRSGDPPVALKRIPVCETDRETIQGALAMLRAENTRQFHQAIAGWRFPTANVVFGDGNGDIGFSLAGALPLRSPAALDVGGAAHDGSASKYDWQAIIPHELVPHVINPEQGYLFSGNHRPVGSFYPIPLGIRTGSMGDTVRSWRLRELLAEKPLLDGKRMLQVQHDTVNPARRVIVRMGFQLRDVLKRELSPDAAQSLEHLEDWYQAGAPSNLEVPGAELAGEISTMFRFVNTPLALRYGGGDSGLSYSMKTISKRLDDDPQAGIEPMEEDFVNRTLSGAWNAALQKYGRDPKRWNALARREVTNRTLGYYQSLDGFPSVDEAQDLSFPPLYCVDGQTVLSQAAQSYSQIVPLDDVDRAVSILPIGVSERPDSPTRTVNMQDWAKGQMHPAPLSREAVEEYAQSRTILAD